MKKADKIREEVSKTYTKAVKSKTGCGCGCGEGDSYATMIAGYNKKELKNLPDDAVSSSFGCGNPLAFAGVKKGEVVLDLGSGAGLDLIIAAQKVGASGKVIGIDMTDEMIATARKNIKKAGLKNVEVKKGLIEKMPVESNSVDWVISNCVINLSPEKDKVFKEIARVLKPGGKMMVSDIVAEDLPDWVLKNMALYSSCISGAVSEKEYISGLKKAGLSGVKVLERLKYGEEQLAGLIEAEIPEVLEALSCCGSKIPPSAFKDVAGKVASVKFFAKKKA